MPPKRTIRLIIFSLLGVCLLLTAAIVETYAGQRLPWKVASNFVQAIGLALFIGSIAWLVDTGVEEVLRSGPKFTLFETRDKGDQRADAVVRALDESKGANLYMTRYSTRPVATKGDMGNVPSAKFVAALRDRLEKTRDDGTKTFRVVSTDNDSKKAHVQELAAEFGDHPYFHLRAFDKASGTELFYDLLVCEGKFTMIGIEGTASRETYWIRIDDPQIAARFRDIYLSKHWERPGASDVVPPPRQPLQS